MGLIQATFLIAASYVVSITFGVTGAALGGMGGAIAGLSVGGVLGFGLIVFAVGR